ncbi:hypothetical protein [Nocardia rhamnosiphila]
MRVRYAARKPEQVGEFHSEGRDGVLLDLDDPRTFAMRSTEWAGQIC